MTSIGIICAMSKEYDLLMDNLYNRKKVSDNSFYGTTTSDGGKSVFVTMSGIGKVNAALCAQKMIDRGVLNIISLGVAGAADETMQVGDVVIGNSYCYHDVWCGSPNKPGQIQGLPSVFPSAFGKCLDKFTNDNHVRFGAIATGDWFVQTMEKVEEIKKFLPSTHNLQAIDMESAAIAQVCYKENIPFLSVRVISDNPLHPNQQEQYDGFWDDMAKKSFETLFKIIK